MRRTQLRYRSINALHYCATNSQFTIAGTLIYSRLTLYQMRVAPTTQLYRRRVSHLSHYTIKLQPYCTKSQMQLHRILLTRQDTLHGENTRGGDDDVRSALVQVHDDMSLFFLYYVNNDTVQEFFIPSSQDHHPRQYLCFYAIGCSTTFSLFFFDSSRT